MAATDGGEGRDGGASDPPPVSAHQSRPDRTVLTEEGNCDGWIASDLVFDVER